MKVVGYKEFLRESKKQITNLQGKNKSAKKKGRFIQK